MNTVEKYLLGLGGVKDVNRRGYWITVEDRKVLIYGSVYDQRKRLSKPFKDFIQSLLKE